jgi:predicted ATPase
MSLAITLVKHRTSERARSHKAHREQRLRSTCRIVVNPNERTFAVSEWSKHWYQATSHDHIGSLYARYALSGVLGRLPPMFEASTLLGRERELAELARATVAGRTVVVLGAPGVGKSALVRAYAAAHPSSVLVRVSSGDSADTLLLRLAREIGLVAQAPVTTHVAQRLGARVLLWDDAELAVDSVQAVLSQLREGEPSLACVLTAMAPLDDEHARSLELCGLAIGDADHEGPAIALFRRRVESMGHTLEAADAKDIASLLEILGGLPLAIELAASRMLVMSPRALLDELVKHSFGAPSGGHAEKMAAVCASAWKALTPSQRRLLQACSFFPGGVSARTVEAVVAATPSPNLLDELAILRRKSLLIADANVGEPRLRLPEPVRAHVESKTRTEPAADGILRAVVAHWALVCQRFVESSLTSETDESALAEEVRREAANIAFARGRGGAHDNRHASYLACGVALALATSPDRALAALSAILDGCKGTPSLSSAEAWALEFAATLERYRGRLTTSEEYLTTLRQAVSRRRAAKSKHDARWHDAAAIRALSGLANGRSYVDEWPEAGRLLERAVRRSERHRSPALFRILPMLAAVHFNQDALEQSRLVLERARRGQEARGDKASLAVSTISLGIVALTDGRLAVARAHLEQGAFEAERRGDAQWHAVATGYLARLTQEEGEPRAALGAFEAARDHLAALGAKRALGLTSLYAATCAVEVGELGRAIDTCRTSLDLLPAEYRCLAYALLSHIARCRTERASAAAHAELARRALTRRVRPSLRLATQILVADDHETARTIARTSGREHHADVRLAVRLVAGRDPRLSQPRSLSIEASCAWFVAPGSSERISLARRKPLRRILAALVDARTSREGSPVEIRDLVRAGWPGENVIEKAAADRVYAAIATLRKLGLRDQLVHEGEGYMLARTWPLAIEGAPGERR